MGVPGLKMAWIYGYPSEIGGLNRHPCKRQRKKSHGGSPGNRNGLDLWSSVNGRRLQSLKIVALEP